MSRMDRLAATLGDADELLAELDAQTIDECLARGEVPDHRDPGDVCHWCGHGFHGLGCHAPTEDVWLVLLYCEAPDGQAMPLVEPGDFGWPCRCDSTLTRLDDTWRPYVDWRDLTSLMHRTGLDGYAAAALFAQRIAELAKRVAQPDHHCPACDAMAARMGVAPVALSPDAAMRVTS